MPGIRIAVDASQVSRAARESERGFDRISRSASMAERGIRNFGNGIGRVTSAIFSLQGALAGIGIGYFGKELFDTGKDIEATRKAFESLTGSTQIMQGEFQFLRDLADEMGQSFYDLLDPYQKLIAASRGTALQGENTRQIFIGITKAAATLGLSSYELKGALIAVSQMISKGNVQAEELRGQLGERLPGAFQIAARAMNMTTAELSKALEQGDVLATDLLPKLATQLQKEYSGEVSDAVRATNKLRESWTDVKVALADAGFLDVISELMVNISQNMSSWIERQKELQSLGLPNFLDSLENSLTQIPGLIKDIYTNISEFANSKEVKFLIDNWKIIAGGLAGARIGRFAGVPGMLAGGVIGAGAGAFFDAEGRQQIGLPEEMQRYFAEGTPSSGGLIPLQIPFDDKTVLTVPTEEQINTTNNLIPNLDASLLAMQRAAESATQQKRAIDELLQSYQMQIDLLGKTEQEQAIYQALQKAGTDITQEEKQQLTELISTYYAKREELDKQEQTIEEYNALLEEGRRITQSVRTEEEIYADTVARLNELFRAGAIDQETYFRAANKAAEMLREQDEEVQKLDRTMAQYGATFTSAFEDAILSGNDFRTILKGLADDILRITLRMQILEPLMNSIFGGGGFLGGLFSSSTPAAAPAHINVTPGGATTAFGMHDGGVVGKDYSFKRTVPSVLFASAPRLHDGGYIKSNEVPTILKKGETVLTPEQMKIVSSNRPNVLVQVIDQRGSGSPVETQTTTDAQGNVDVRLLIRDEVRKTLASGRADGVMNSSYALQRKPIRR